MGEYDAARRAYRVTGLASHAWVEVYFPSYGWVEFEPTPSQSPFDRPAGAVDSAATASPPAVTAAAGEPAARALGVVVGIAVAALAVLGWVWWQTAGRRRPDTPRQQALRLYRRMRGALARAGLGAPASVTADEFLEGFNADLAARPALLAAVREATGLFREAAYSQHEVSVDRARGAQRLWQAARLSWLGLAARRLLPAKWRGEK
jgi:hypothetical protein